MSLTRRTEELAAALEEAGYEVLRPTPMGECMELIVKRGGDAVFVYTYPGRFTDALVAKIAASPSDCHRALLDPRGLYALVLGSDDYKRVPGKIERLIKIARRAKHF